MPCRVSRRSPPHPRPRPGAPPTHNNSKLHAQATTTDSDRTFAPTGSSYLPHPAQPNPRTVPYCMENMKETVTPTITVVVVIAVVVVIVVVLIVAVVVGLTHL